MGRARSGARAVAWYWDGCVRVLFGIFLWGVLDGVKGIGAGSVSGVRARYFLLPIQRTREGEWDAM
jgi:hypothetical protein